MIKYLIFAVVIFIATANTVVSQSMFTERGEWGVSVTGGLHFLRDGVVGKSLGASATIGGVLEIGVEGGEISNSETVGVMYASIRLSRKKISSFISFGVVPGAGGGKVPLIVGLSLGKKIAVSNGISLYPTFGIVVPVPFEAFGFGLELPILFGKTLAISPTLSVLNKDIVFGLNSTLMFLW